jgi:hypothetical protein
VLLCIERLLCPSVTNTDLGAMICPLLDKNICGVLVSMPASRAVNQWFELQYTPSVSTIILSGPTYSSQNVRQIWESTLSKSDYTRVFTYLHILHTGKKVRLQIRIDHKMFDIFTSRNVKKNLLISTKKGSSKVSICHARAQQSFDA